jgi:uncharacterized protein (DUF4415 family)
VSEKSTARVSLETLQARRERGDIRHDPQAPERDDLGRDFWAHAEAQAPKSEIQSVHLKVDKEVFDFFKSAGKGHLTRMQDVLRAYARAHGGLRR